MTNLLLAASLLTRTASAWVVDLSTDGVPIGQVDGRSAVQVEIPTSVMAEQETIRFLGGRGTTVRALGTLSCVVRLPDGKGSLSAANDDCAQLYALPPGAARDLVVQAPPPAPGTLLRLRLPEAVPAGAVGLLADGRLTLPGVPAEAPFASVYASGRWWVAAVDPASGAFTLDGPGSAALDAWLAAPEGRLVVRAEQSDGTELQWVLAAEAVPEALPRPMPAPEPVAAAPADPQPADGGWCATEAAPGQAGPVFLYCLDAASGAVTTRRLLATGAVAETDARTLPTGSFIEVAVRHTAGVPVTVELSDGAILSRGEEVLGLLPTPTGAASQTTRRRFAPRDSGALSLTIGSPDGILSREELLVVTRYSGALRVGLGLAMPGTGLYSVGEEDPDTGTGPLEGGVEPIEGELLIGFAPFLDVGGRDYLDPAPYYLSPFIGVGVLASSGADLRFSLLQSLYAGVDLELARSFAVDLAFTLRRVRRLEPGVELDDLVDPDQDLPTRQVFRPGLAVAFTVTPDLFRFQARSR